MTSSSASPIASKSVRTRSLVEPTLSPEHGVYVILVVSVILGSAAAHQWTGLTTLAAIAAFCGFQAEHPLVMQIKQRKSWKPRFLLWGGVYSAIALAIALYLYWHWSTVPTANPLLLLGIYVGAIAALAVDAISVLQREQKSIVNEVITFAAVCLSVPFVYAATTGHGSLTVGGLWLLATLFFSSTIFTVKLRKARSDTPVWQPILRILGYEAIALLILLGIWGGGWLSLITLSAFGIAVVKVGWILWQRHWYCTCPIQQVAILETSSALLFGAIAAISLLPAHLPG